MNTMPHTDNLLSVEVDDEMLLAARRATAHLKDDEDEIIATQFRAMLAVLLARGSVVLVNDVSAEAGATFLQESFLGPTEFWDRSQALSLAERFISACASPSVRADIKSLVLLENAFNRREQSAPGMQG